MAVLIVALHGADDWRGDPDGGGLLREQFGDAYDAYAEARAPRCERRFSLARAWRNKEYRAMIGLSRCSCCSFAGCGCEVRVI